MMNRARLVMLAVVALLSGCSSSKKTQTTTSTESAAQVTGDQAVMLGANTANDVMGLWSSTDSDCTSGAGELRQTVPEIGQAFEQAPAGYAVGNTASSPTALHRALSTAANQELANTDLQGPVVGPDNTSGWYFWEHAAGENMWKLWTKCNPAADLRAGWPVGVAEWWWGWTGESGSPSGYTYVSHYTVLSAAHTTGDYRLDVGVAAPNGVGSWFSGEYDWTNYLNATADYAAHASWKSHSVGSGQNTTHDNFGRYNTQGTYAFGNWSWNYFWYIGAGTTDDPGYTSRAQCPGDDRAASPSSLGLLYWGEGQSQWLTGSWSSDYCSYSYDSTCSESCTSFARPKFSWQKGCIRSLSVLEGDETWSNPATRWDLASDFAAGSYIPTSISYNATVPNATAEHKAEALSPVIVYTAVATTNDGVRHKKTFSGWERLVPFDIDGDTCGGDIIGVTVAPAQASLFVGEHQQFLASVQDNYGNNVPTNFVWSSDNTATLTVSAGGDATAVAIGSATVSAQTAGHSGAATVVVASPPLPSTPAELAATAGDQ